jgi:hypothetical protein
MHSVVRRHLCFALAILAFQRLDAQPHVGTTAQVGWPAVLEQINSETGLTQAGLLKLVKQLLADPDVLNSVLEPALNGPKRPPLLANLKVRFATFEAANSNTRGLGLNYSYSYSVKRQQFTQAPSRTTGLDFRLNSAGNVAFERKINPRDFLTSDLALSFFLSNGGVTGTTTPTTQARLVTLQTELAKIEDEAALERSPLMAEYVRLAAARLSTQRFIDLAVTGGLESDQSFQQKSYVYGGRVGLDIKAWNPQSGLAQWNLFDWPFALLRRLNGTDSSFTPLGSTIPTVLAGVALVDPQDDDGREALGALDAYPRLNIEAAFRTLVLRSAAGPLYFQSDARWYRELNAPAAIRQAKLRAFSYVALALVSEQGPYVSYTKGRLPVDLRKDEVYELGFKLYF